MTTTQLHPTVDDVYASLSGIPCSAAVIGLEVVARLTNSRPDPYTHGSIPQALARHGLTVGRIQKALDVLVAERRAFRVSTRPGSKTSGYISDEAMARIEAREAAEEAARRPLVLAERARQIVLERHADEVAAVLAELTAAD